MPGTIDTFVQPLLADPRFEAMIAYAVDVFCTTEESSDVRGFAEYIFSGGYLVDPPEEWDHQALCEALVPLCRDAGVVVKMQEDLFGDDTKYFVVE